HLYESGAHDAARLADAELVVANGLGYDEFVDKLLSATSSHGQRVLKAATVLHIDGSDANPHLWYDVGRIHDVARAIVDNLVAIDAIDRPEFEANLTRFDASMRPVLALVDRIKLEYPHAPVAYTERVPEYLLRAADLDVLSPTGFARAIED